MPLLHFQQFGQGKPVLFLHGLFGQSDNLLTVAKHFATKYHVILPDLPNHGKSFHCTYMSYTTMAQSVHELLRKLEITNCIVVGHSMGGKVAMQLALDFPDTVLKLVIVDIAPVKYPDLHSNVFDALHAVLESGCKNRAEADAILKTIITEKMVRQFLLKSFKRDEQGRWGWQFNLDAIKSNYANLREAPDMEKPFLGGTLFIKGENSDYIVSDYKKQSYQFFPELSVKIIQGAGHWLHVEKPKAFTRLLERFFQEVD